jgi:hypothetical protein
MRTFLLVCCGMLLLAAFGSGAGEKELGPEWTPGPSPGVFKRLIAAEAQRSAAGDVTTYTLTTLGKTPIAVREADDRQGIGVSFRGEASFGMRKNAQGDLASCSFSVGEVTYFDFDGDGHIDALIDGTPARGRQPRIVYDGRFVDVRDYLNVFADRVAQGRDGKRYVFRDGKWQIQSWAAVVPPAAKAQEKKEGGAGPKDPDRMPGPAGNAPEGEKLAVKRKALWDALKQALPNVLEDMDAYGENATLTAVCFTGRGQVFVFSLEDHRVEKVMLEKAVPRINRITFEDDSQTETGLPGSGRFVLWRGGDVELRVIRIRW